MFYRQILELPCCKQSVCIFCFDEYVQKRMTGITEVKAAVGGAGKGSAVMPVGMPCPQCAVVQKGAAAELRTLDGKEESGRTYVDSPRTRAHMEHAKRIAAGPGPDGTGNSPLKVCNPRAWAAISATCTPTPCCPCQVPSLPSTRLPRPCALCICISMRCAMRSAACDAPGHCE